MRSLVAVLVAILLMSPMGIFQYHNIQALELGYVPPDVPMWCQWVFFLDMVVGLTFLVFAITDTQREPKVTRIVRFGP